MADDELRMYIEFLRLGAEDDFRPSELQEKEFLLKLLGFGKNKDEKEKIKNAGKPFHTGQKLPPKEKWISSGCVVFDSLKDLGHVYVIQQKNWNTWAFPKGRVDAGESIKKTAVREVAEETGLQVQLLPGGYLGKGVGSMSVTHFFTAVRVGGSPGQHDQEVERVKLVSFTEAYKLFKRSGGSAGKRDMMILRRAWEWTNQWRREKYGEEVPEEVPF